MFLYLANGKIKEIIRMSKNKNEITIHGYASEYFTYVAAVGDDADIVEMHYEE